MKEKRAVWTTKTQTSSSTPALSSTFFFSLSISLPLSLFLPLPPPFSFFHLSVREKSQQIHFSFGRRSESARLSARILPSLIPPQITFSLHPFIQYLSFFYHLSTVLHSFSLSHTHMLPCSLSQCQKWRIPNTTSLFSVIKTPDPIRTVLERRHSGTIFFSGNCGSLKIFSSHGLSAFLNQDCEMLQWHESAPYIWRLTLHLLRPVQRADAEKKYLCTWSEISFMFFSSYLIEGACWSWVRRPHDSTCPTKFLRCARARFNPQQDIYTVHDCCMRTHCILQKCTNTPTCVQARTHESHLSSSLFSTTFYCSACLRLCVCVCVWSCIITGLKLIVHMVVFDGLDTVRVKIQKVLLCEWLIVWVCWLFG